nr:pentapeptide repeat-containing protein [Aquimarina sp. MMG016]
MKPYRYSEEGKLIKKKISPERGQLLYSLVKSDLGEQSLSDVFYAGDFEYSDLKGVTLGRGLYLKYARLNHSDLTEANIPAVNLESSELREAEMHKVNLSDANLKRSRLIRANLNNAELAGADLTNANLSGADLSDADLSEAKLWGTKLIDTDLSDVILDNAIVHRQDWIAYVADSLDLKGSGRIEDTYRVKKQGKQQFILVAR